MDDAQQQALAAQLAKLRANYLARLLAELAALQALGADLHGGERGRASLNELHKRLHKLTGSGGTFGLTSLSAAARALEQRVQAWLAGDLDGMDATACRSLAADLAALSRTADDIDEPSALIPGLARGGRRRARRAAARPT